MDVFTIPAVSKEELARGLDAVLNRDLKFVVKTPYDWFLSLFDAC